MDRAWYREVIEEPDPERQLQLNARNARMVKTRIAGVLKVIRHAAELTPRAPSCGRASSPTSTTTSGRSSVAGREGSAPARPRCRPRERHPLDAQPPRPVAVARRRARLDARAVGSLVRGDVARPVASGHERVPEIADVTVVPAALTVRAYRWSPERTSLGRPPSASASSAPVASDRSTFARCSRCQGSPPSPCATPTGRARGLAGELGVVGGRHAGGTRRRRRRRARDRTPTPAHAPLLRLAAQAGLPRSARSPWPSTWRARRR